MKALDELRAIEKRIVDGPDTDEAWQERVMLSHLLRPAFEVLEGVGCQDAYEPGGTAREDVEKHCCGGTGNRRCSRCAVLAQLEEALK